MRRKEDRCVSKNFSDPFGASSRLPRPKTSSRGALGRHERRIYKASKRLGLVSIAGHTHRPLFESLSKYDSLRYSMESLIRDYPRADKEERDFVIPCLFNTGCATGGSGLTAIEIEREALFKDRLALCPH
jgi:hypothetical protein